MKAFTHLDALTVADASAALAKGNAMALAGGTDVLDTLKERTLPDAMYPAVIVNLKTISPSLSYITESGGMLKVGALTVLEDIATSSVVQTKYTALAQAAGKVASPHIREMGTIGGNICQLNRCWYFRHEDNFFNCIRKGGTTCYAIAGDNRFHSIFGMVKACFAVNPSDIAPALVAMNANIVTNKKTIPAEQFWDMVVPGSTTLTAGEIVTEIQVPTPASGIKSAFIKMAIRQSIDFPLVNCAAMIGAGSARICLNAVYNKPYRATAAETSITGKTITNDTADAAGAAAVASASALAASGVNPGNKYKVQIAKAMVKRAILACA
jgi:xanthine dehydrogenase YagS FAD-binding subunit